MQKDRIHKFLFQQSKLLIIFGITMLWLLLFSTWANWITANPLDEEIALNPKGEVRKEINLKIPETYELVLVFERANIPYRNLRNILGESSYHNGKSIHSGVIIPIQWSLMSLKSGLTVANGQIDSFGTTAWSSTEIDRQIGTIKAPTGRYLFTAKIMRDIPELMNIKTRISAQLSPKVTSTWQVTFVFLGSLINSILVWPAAFLMGLFLLWQAALLLLSSRRVAATVSNR